MNDFVLEIEEMPDIEMEMDFSAGFLADHDHRYINPRPRKQIPERMLKFDNAIKLAKVIEMGTSSRSHALLAGNFIMGDFIEALFVSKNMHTKNLSVSTLSMSENNVDSFRNLIDGGYIDNLDLIVSGYFFSHERNALIPYMLEELDQDDRFQMAVSGTHTKICIFETDGGKKFVIHGSANLRSSDNIEQITIEETPELYDFYKDFHDTVIKDYNIINKDKTGKQLWQAIATRAEGKVAKHLHPDTDPQRKAGQGKTSTSRQSSRQVRRHFKTFGE